jgi:hypothetical protein
MLEVKPDPSRKVEPAVTREICNTANSATLQFLHAGGAGMFCPLLWYGSGNRTGAGLAQAV